MAQVGTAWGSYRMPSDPALVDQHEYILIFRKNGQRHRPKVYELINKNDFHSWRNSVWKISPESAKRIGHIAPFPIEIPRRLITMYTFKGETVLDPFMGSGTTGVACAEIDRNFIGIEIDKEYCEIAEKRIKEAQSQIKMKI